MFAHVPGSFHLSGLKRDNGGSGGAKGGGGCRSVQLPLFDRLFGDIEISEDLEFKEEIKKENIQLQAIGPSAQCVEYVWLLGGTQGFGGFYEPFVRMCCEDG